MKKRQAKQKEQKRSFKEKLKKFVLIALIN